MPSLPPSYTGASKAIAVGEDRELAAVLNGRRGELGEAKLIRLLENIMHSASS